MKITLQDALSLLSKHAEERTPVLAAFVTPSVSVANDNGHIYLRIVLPHVLRPVLLPEFLVNVTGRLSRPRSTSPRLQRSALDGMSILRFGILRSSVAIAI